MDYATTNGERGCPTLWFNKCEDYLFVLNLLDEDFATYEAFRPANKKEQIRKSNMMSGLCLSIHALRSIEDKINTMWGLD